MKQKNYDVNQLYKDYMQNVNADPTAIDEIISGERQPVNTGARIKHSAGKLASITAAAAVLAVCAGFGLTNLNMNDDSSVKSAATTSSITTTQQESSLAPAQQQADLKAEVTEMYASDHLLRIRYKLSVNTKEGKELFDKAVMHRNNTEAPLTVERKEGSQPANGFNVNTMTLPEVDVDNGTITQNVSFVSDDGTGTLKDGETMDMMVNVFGTTKVPLKVTIKKNLTERVFSAPNGKKLWLTDIGLVCEMNDKMYMTNPNILKLKFSDGKERSDMDTSEDFSIRFSDEKNGRMYQFANTDTSKVTSVEFSGEVFTPYVKAEPQFKTEMTEMFASDHSLRITVKLTALNEKAKKLLDEDAEKYRKGKIGDIHVSAAANAEQNKYACVSTTTPVINGNTLTTTLFYQMINSTDVYNDGDKIKIMFGMNGELEEFEKCPEDRKITVAIKKNMTERVFKSASGKTMWLSDYHFNVGMDGNGMDKQTKNNFEIAFSDGTVKTPFNMQCLAGGATRSDKGDPNIMFGFEKKIDKTKVTSVKYAGEVFTAQ